MECLRCGMHQVVSSTHTQHHRLGDLESFLSHGVRSALTLQVTHSPTRSAVPSSGSFMHQPSGRTPLEGSDTSRLSVDLCLDGGGTDFRKAVSTLANACARSLVSCCAAASVVRLQPPQETGSPGARWEPGAGPSNVPPSNANGQRHTPARSPMSPSIVNACCRSRRHAHSHVTL